VLSRWACGCLRFRTDGSIGVGVQAGGYMETLFWEYPQTAGDLPFGTVVQRNVLANLHDHLAGALCTVADVGLTTTHLEAC
jgi:Cu2+-containing amine oxidase